MSQARRGAQKPDEGRANRATATHPAGSERKGVGAPLRSIAGGVV
jgi:hypothetical protein